MSNSERDILKSIKEYVNKFTDVNPEYTSKDSMGNYDDVFYDGYCQGEYDIVTAIRNLIKEGENK